MAAKSLTRYEDTEKYKSRRARAEKEHIKMQVAGPNAFAMTGDSGRTHLIDTEGMKAVYCTCEDNNQNLSSHEKCKHQIAYEEWLVDEVIA